MQLIGKDGWRNMGVNLEYLSLDYFVPFQKGKEVWRNIIRRATIHENELLERVWTLKLPKYLICKNNPKFGRAK